MMEYQSVIAQLYYLLIYADGNVNEKEVALGKQMAKIEGLDSFETRIQALIENPPSNLLANSINTLKKLERKQQIRCIAWMCVIANSDGFMDKEEWALIYKIYNNELGLALNEIMETQKELNKALFGSSFQSFGVKVND
jgi:uncharacterized tellurite resistance protein B-like protein